MANPNPTPNPENLQPPWGAGQSGNPGGHSRGRRLTRLARIIEEKGLDEVIAVTWLGAALGDEKLLKGKKPNAAFFAMMLDRLEGKVTDASEVDDKPSEAPKRLTMQDVDDRYPEEIQG